MFQTMRQMTKLIWWILATAFVAWLVFGVGMNSTGRSSSSRDVGSVNGTPIHYQTYLDAYRAAYDQARAQNPGVTFSREDQREIETRAFNQLVDAELLKEELYFHGVVIVEGGILGQRAIARPIENCK